MAIRRRLSIQVGDSKGSYQGVPLEIMEVDSACILKVRPRSFPNRLAGGYIRGRKKAGLTADFGAWTNGDGVAVTDVSGRSCLCLGFSFRHIEFEMPRDGRWSSDSGHSGEVTIGRVQVGDVAVEMVLEPVRLEAAPLGAWGSHRACTLPESGLSGPKSLLAHLFTPTSSLQICQFSTSSIYSSCC